MIANSFEDILASAKTGGWGFLEQAPEAVRKQQETQQKLREEDRKAIARAWYEFSESPEGRKALELLFDTTLRRATYYAHLGLEPGTVAMYGAFREGQNAVAQEIARQIAAGMGEDVKPRD